MKAMKRSHSVLRFYVCIASVFLYPAAPFILSTKSPISKAAAGLSPCSERLSLVPAESVRRRLQITKLCYNTLDNKEAQPLERGNSTKNNPRVVDMAKTMIDSLPSDLRTKISNRNETDVYVHDDSMDDVIENKTNGFFRVAKRVRRFPKRLRSKLPSRNKNKTESDTIVVSNVDELRDAVLVNKIPLKDLDFNVSSINYTHVTNHPVMVLLAERVRTNSTPANRAPTDDAHLALSIEGGGMRGAVSAGMAAAIASLGLNDAFDSIYGSSAGCVVGAYLVSRQMCLDVYTDVLPAAKGLFASKRRVVGNLGVGIVNDAVARLSSKTENGNNNESNDSGASAVDHLNNATALGGHSVETSRKSKRRRLLSFVTPVRRSFSQLKPYFKLGPGMNISFVLDGIMSEQHGLRPFDLEAFRINDAKQPLKVVSSTVRGGELETVAFGSSDGDFWDTEEVLVEEVLQESRRRRAVAALKNAMGVVKNFVVGTAKTTWRFLSKVRRRRDTEDAGQDEKRDDVEGESLLPVERSATSLAPGSQALSGITCKNKRKEKRKGLQKKVRLRKATESIDDPNKKGFFACIEASMLVPGAAGPPIKVLRSKHRKESKTVGVGAMSSTCFDAFCYEPIPFRSAVEDGATHVLALRSRPEGCFVETKPAVYERVVAPVYFRLNGLPTVGEFFSSGGSQYRYLEDVMTLDDGLAKGCGNATATESSMGVKVPPTELLFGTDKDEGLVVNTDTWKRAHLLPVKVPEGTPELPALTQDKDEVTQAVRQGYAAAFDMLAPIVGLDSRLEGERVAELLFPLRQDDDMRVLGTPVKVKGEEIEDYSREEKARRSFVQWIAGKREARRKTKEDVLRDPTSSVVLEVERSTPDTKLYAKQDGLDWLEAEALLAALPGFQQGKLNYLAEGLRSNRTQSG